MTEGKQQAANELTGEQRMRAEAFLQGRKATLKDLHGRGELNGRVMVQELLLLLPAEFTRAYEELFWQAFRDPFAGHTKTGDGSEGVPVKQYERIPIRASKDGDGVMRGDIIGYRNGKEIKPSKQDQEDMKHGRVVALGKAMGTTGTVMGSETRAQAQGTGRKFKEHGLVMGSEKAFERKKWVDQKLKGLAQDILVTLDSRNAAGKIPQKRCTGTGCSKMMDWKWQYCPSCGADSRSQRS